MIRIGIGQIEPRLMDCEHNVQQLKDILTEATSSGIEVLVLPELCNSGYAFDSKDEAQACAESIPEGEFSQNLREWSKDNRLVVAGVCEKTSDGLYNSAAAFRQGKHITTYRKVHLFNLEKDWFLQGTKEPPVIGFRQYHFGIMVCWDWVFPEMARILAIKGAQVILHPANLVLAYCQNAMITRSIENGVFSVTANRVGQERELSFSGKSQVVNPKGKILLKMNEAEVGVKWIDIEPIIADSKMLTKRNHLLKDRRPDIYKKLI